MTKEADGTKEERRKRENQCYLMPRRIGTSKHKELASETEQEQNNRKRL
jgi:hypothetical protein